MIACAVTDLPEPGLAEDGQRLALVAGEGDAVDRLGHAVAGAELDVQVVDLEQQPVLGLPAAPAAGSSVVARVTSRSSGPRSAQLRVEGVADGVAEHDEGQHGERQEEAREEQHVRRGPDQPDAGGVGDRDAPGDGRRLQPDAEERQRRLGRDEDAEVDGARPRSPGPARWAGCADDDPGRRGAERPGGLHVVVRLDLQHAGAHQPGDRSASRATASTRATLPTMTRYGVVEVAREDVEEQDRRRAAAGCAKKISPIRLSSSASSQPPK